MGEIKFFEQKVFLKTFVNKATINKLKKFTFKKEPYYFICNEFFDALPINQYEKKKDILYEKRMVIKNNKFKIIRKKLNFPLLKLSNVKNGELIEISPLSDLYLNKIFNHLSKFGGGIFIFDYGPLQKKKIDTIQAIRKKKK